MDPEGSCEKEFLIASTGALIVFVMMALAPSSASAASLSAPAPTGYAVDRSAVPACHVTPKSGVSGVNVRSRANDDSTRLGIIQPGQQAPAACEATSGSSYTACGGTSDWWVQVKWDGRTGYVAQLCVDWYSS